MPPAYAHPKKKSQPISKMQQVENFSVVVVVVAAAAIVIVIVIVVVVVVVVVVIVKAEGSDTIVGRKIIIK